MTRRSFAAACLALVLSLGLGGAAFAADPVVPTPVVVTDPAIPVVATDPVPFPRSFRPPRPAPFYPPGEFVETMGLGPAGIYVGSPGAIRYIPGFLYQLISSDPQGGWSCTAYAVGMAVSKASYGGSRPTGAAIRALSGAAPYTGLTLADGARAAARLYVSLTNRVGTWADVMAALRARRGVVLQGDYDQIPDAYSGQPSFDGNHAIYADYLHSSGNYLYVMDPLQRKGARWVPISIMRNYAEKLGRAQGIYPRVFYAVTVPTRFFH